MAFRQSTLKEIEQLEEAIAGEIVLGSDDPEKRMKEIQRLLAEHRNAVLSVAGVHIYREPVSKSG